MKRFRQSVCAIFFVAILATLAPVQAKLTNVSDSTGLDYVHAVEVEVPTIEDLGLDRETVTLVSNHAGAAAADFDGDGLTDFIAGRYQLRPVLYINQGGGVFVEEGQSRGLSTGVDAAAFGVGDLDNDGDQDIFAVPHYGDRYFLFINDGTGNFLEEAIERNADLETSVEPHEGYTVSLVDYDLDGFLDVYVSEWGPIGPEELGLHSVLLRNIGSSNPAHFENATEEAGLLQPPPGIGSQHGFSAAWADFDSDGWPDLYLVADFSSSRMYWNNGNGTFSEATDESGLGKEEFGMGVAVADFDRDGDLDIYATSIFDQILFNQNGSNHGNKLYENIGNRKFVEISGERGVDRSGWGWGTAFFDYENDGDLDLIATNGSDSAAWAQGSPGEVPHLAALDDQSYLFRNDGSGAFFDTSTVSGITDTGMGKAVVVLDLENDGDEDVIITNTYGSSIVYENDAADSDRDWIRFKLEGRHSNRDGIGAVISVTESGVTQTALYNPTNAYIGQREPFVHFGLGVSDGTVDAVTIRWPSGVVQALSDVLVNRVHAALEPEVALPAPAFTKDLIGGTFVFGQRFELSVETTSVPAASYVWKRDGQVIEGAIGPVYLQKRFQPIDIGSYQVTAINANGSTQSSVVNVNTSSVLDGKSSARLWNEFMLEAIRKDFPDPTVHSRNLYHVSAAMWDAFWAYEVDAWDRVKPVFEKELPSPESLGELRRAHQNEAISHAAFRVLSHRYADSPGADRSLFGFRWLMLQMGFDPDDEAAIGDSAAAVGNRIGFSVIEQALLDGSNEANAYADTSGYAPINEPLVFDLTGSDLVDPNLWQPLAFDFLVTQNGIPIGKSIQTFLGVNWREVDTFALPKTSSNTIGFDPGPPPQWGTDSEQEYLDAAVEVIRFSSLLDPNQSEMIDISPGARLNNTLGQNDGEGRSMNPYTGLEYEENWVKHADYGRVLAEFWADGPSSETPPGHWNALHNEISDHPLFERRYGGQGEVLGHLEWDVRAYLALNGAMHDAAVAAWTLKRQYDYIRPVSIIRYLGGLGQSSDSNVDSYHAQGLPLELGLVELITPESIASGERHEHLSAQLGKIAILAWAGEPDDHESEVGGVDWILAEDWMPYQRSSFVTPAFAAYVSGHSTFSRAAAEVMTLLTGSPFFPGGLGEFHFEEETYLEFEKGPSQDLTLQWATYYDAADQAGLSRLYGGIHVSADDVIGRTLGARVGLEAFLKAAALGGMSSGESPLDYVRDERSASIGGQASMTRLFYSDTSKGKLAPRRPLDEESFLADPMGADAGIYFTITDGGLQTHVRGDGVDGMEISGYIDGGEGRLDLEFEIVGEEISTVLGRGKSASEDLYSDIGLLFDPQLTLYRFSEPTQWEEMDRNDDWIEHDLASLSETLALRESMEGFDRGGREAAIVAQLGAGRYRLSLEGSGDASGMATLELRVSSYEGGSE